MTVLQKHEDKQENGPKYLRYQPTNFEGYISGGDIRDSEHNIVGFTPSEIRQCIETILDPRFAYARSRNYGITIYGRDPESPTGVSSIGGLPHELEWLLEVFKKPGSLSPTEGLRSAR